LIKLNNFYDKDQSTFDALTEEQFIRLIRDEVSNVLMLPNYPERRKKMDVQRKRLNSRIIGIPIAFAILV